LLEKKWNEVQLIQPLAWKLNKINTKYIYAERKTKRKKQGINK